MPVFTFEKISPPMRRVSLSPTPAVEKPRSVIGQIINRLVDKRVKRTAIADKVAQSPVRERKQAK